MRLSELILEINYFIKEHGDVDVEVDIPDGMHCLDKETQKYMPVLGTVYGGEPGVGRVIACEIASIAIER